MSDFYKALVEELKQKLNNSVQVEHVKSKGNNGVEINRISLKNEKEAIAPAFHVDGARAEYFKGTQTITSIADTIIRMYQSEKLPKINIPFLMKYSERIEKRIRMKLINLPRNEEFLNQGTHPHVRFEKSNLAGIFYMHILVDENDPSSDMLGTIEITYNLLEVWNVKLSAMDLYQIAIDNTEKDDEICIWSVMDIIREKLDGTTQKISNPVPMYMVSSRNRLYGASVIFTDCVKEMLREKFKTDKVFLLPSSVHELIALEFCPENADAYCCMIKEVNMTEVEIKDRLSYELLVLDLMTGELEVYKEAED